MACGNFPLGFAKKTLKCGVLMLVATSSVQSIFVSFRLNHDEQCAEQVPDNAQIRIFLLHFCMNYFANGR